jgi:hypothetical protein
VLTATLNPGPLHVGRFELWPQFLEWFPHSHVRTWGQPPQTFRVDSFDAPQAQMHVMAFKRTHDFPERQAREPPAGRAC